jgi:ribosomal protein S21
MSNRDFKGKRREREIRSCVEVRASDFGGDYNADKMVRRFNKTIKREGVVDECRERAYYKKPSVKRQERLEERDRVISRANQRNSELLTSKRLTFKSRKPRNNN